MRVIRVLDRFGGTHALTRFLWLPRLKTKRTPNLAFLDQPMVSRLLYLILRFGNNIADWASDRWNEICKNPTIGANGSSLWFTKLLFSQGVLKGPGSTAKDWMLLQWLRIHSDCNAVQSRCGWECLWTDLERVLVTSKKQEHQDSLLDHPSLRLSPSFRRFRRNVWDWTCNKCGKIRKKRTSTDTSSTFWWLLKFQKFQSSQGAELSWNYDWRLSIVPGVGFPSHWTKCLWLSRALDKSSIIQALERLQREIWQTWLDDGIATVTAFPKFQKQYCRSDQWINCPTRSASKLKQNCFFLWFLVPVQPKRTQSLIDPAIVSKLSPPFRGFRRKNANWNCTECNEINKNPMAIGAKWISWWLLTIRTFQLSQRAGTARNYYQRSRVGPEVEVPQC